jgi:hypothetical protein
MLSAAGPAWPPPPENAPARRWVNARSFPAVWRDSLTLGGGSLVAAARGHPAAVRPWRPWDHRPEPESDADILQAITAKAHLCIRTMPLLASAQVVVLEPELLEAVPDWPTPEAHAEYAAQAKLPASPVFLDVEGSDGRPVHWLAETWPLPFHLRGALCWRHD